MCAARIKSSCIRHCAMCAAGIKSCCIRHCAMCAARIKKQLHKALRKALHKKKYSAVLIIRCRGLLYKTIKRV